MTATDATTATRTIRTTAPDGTVYRTELTTRSVRRTSWAVFAEPAAPTEPERLIDMGGRASLGEAYGAACAALAEVMF